MATKIPQGVDSIWDELVHTPHVGEDILFKRVLPDSKCDVFVGVRKPRDLLTVFLEVEGTSLQHVSEYPRAEGVIVEVVPLGTGRLRRVRIILSASSQSYHDVFRVLGRDVIDSLTGVMAERDGVDRFIDRLCHWQSFLRRSTSQGLGREAQQGLYGELLTLQTELLPELGPEKAVSSWTGPTGSNQDFQLGGVGIETKTSSANSHQRIFISDARQLDTTGFRKLYLQFWSLDVRPGMSNTLPGLVGATRNSVSGSTVASELFATRLLEAGYRDLHADQYEGTTYAIRRKYVFDCRAGFPRIEPLGLPTGIGDVTYSVDLAVCQSFEVTDSEFRAAVGALRNG